MIFSHHSLLDVSNADLCFSRGRFHDIQIGNESKIKGKIVGYSFVAYLARRRRSLRALKHFISDLLAVILLGLGTKTPYQ